MTAQITPPTTPTTPAAATPGEFPAETGYKKVDSWFELPELERGILDLWAREKAFETLVRQNTGSGKKFSFLDGPITANNPMGVHHAWGRTLKDAYQRYHAMHGCELRYQNGFDCQGLWVEVEVEKELGFKTKAEIEAYGIEKFVEACKARVRKFARRQTSQSIRLGMWMDWGNWDHEDWDENDPATRPGSYFTMAAENNYTIWSFLKKCHERGKIYRGYDVMPWSGRSGSAYSQMEVIEGRKLVAHTAIFVKFPLADSPTGVQENLLVWTTTPWTLSSNIAAAVNPELDYVRIRSKRDNEIYIFAKDNLNFQRLERQFSEDKEWVEGVPKLKTIGQMFNERGGFDIVDTIKGKDLVGRSYRGPFDELEAQSIAGGYPFTDEKNPLSARDAHKVIDGGRDSHGSPTVVAGEGTGIVHTAPGCGDIDFVIGKALGLPMLAPLDAAACFLPGFGFLEGRLATAKDTVEAIIASLKDKGLLFATEPYPHVYPHCWRTGDELVFRLVDEWYINMDWRDEIKDLVGQINWMPEWGRDRENEWLTNMRDWMISKKRYWGLALPIWVTDDHDEFEVIGSYDELKARAVEGWDEFAGHSPHRPWIDKVVIKSLKTGKRMTRIPDVGNPWLDAGIVPYSTVRYNSDRDYWKQWVPADLVIECFPGQFRNWFYSLLSMSTMMEHVPPFKTLLGYALVRDEHGEEMHKSKGNAIWFDDAADQAGADVMRWLYCRQETAQNLNFGFTALREVRGKFINTLWNTYGFFVNYARLEGFVYDENEAVALRDRTAFDRWIITELERTKAAVSDGFARYDMRTACLAIEAFVESLSNWYVRHNRRRFWKADGDAQSHAAFDTLYECLETVIRLAAPMIPFVTEAIYQNLVRAVRPGAPASVHHTTFPERDTAREDAALAAEMEAIIRITGIALSARDAKKLKLRQPLAKMTIGPRDAIERTACEQFHEMLMDELNVKEIEVLEPGVASPLQFSVTANFKSLGKRAGTKMKALAAAIEADAAGLAARLNAGDQGFTLTVEGEPFDLTREDLKVVASSPENTTCAEEKGTWVAFDTVITDELATEGRAREIQRRVQVLRKDKGLEVEDRIALSWFTDAPSLAAAMTDHKPTLAAELLATLFEPVAAAAELDNPATIEIDGAKLFVEIRKV